VEWTTGAWRTGADAGATARTGAAAGRDGAEDELELELEELELEELELLLLLAARAGSDNASAASARLAGMMMRVDVMTLLQEAKYSNRQNAGHRKAAKAALFLCNS